LERDAELQGAALHLFLREVEQCLRAHSAFGGEAMKRMALSQADSMPPGGWTRGPGHCTASVETVLMAAAPRAA
jgi:hypothetical protein